MISRLQLLANHFTICKFSKWIHKPCTVWIIKIGFVSLSSDLNEILVQCHFKKHHLGRIFETLTHKELILRPPKIIFEKEITEKTITSSKMVCMKCNKKQTDIECSGDILCSNECVLLCV